MRTAANFFTAEEQKQLVEAIAHAELHTSGEIRLHVANFCLGDEVKAARKIFLKLGMHQTKERNGVLFYLAVLSHKLAVIGDEGIHRQLGDEFWKHLTEQLVTDFRQNRKAESLAGSIRECGRQLGIYFPRTDNDKDELSNTISFR
jgi:uncharacterized membrane protein